MLDEAHIVAVATGVEPVPYGTEDSCTSESVVLYLSDVVLVDTSQGDDFLVDDAILVGMNRVRILHGTGTGILRTLIRQYLQSVPGVVHFQDEHVQFGGAGITVVDL